MIFITDELGKFEKNIIELAENMGFKECKTIEAIDLFCGIGGFRLAMNSSQVECVFSSDNDKFAQQTYEANFHEVPTGDIKAVNEKDIPSFDILTAGFPCQPFSYSIEKECSSF